MNMLLFSVLPWLLDKRVLVTNIINASNILAPHHQPTRSMRPKKRWKTVAHLGGSVGREVGNLVCVLLLVMATISLDINLQDPRNFSFIFFTDGKISYL
jgi:hypothetical protein